MTKGFETDEKRVNFASNIRVDLAFLYADTESDDPKVSRCAHATCTQN